jgi:hypothetical protein
MKTLRLLPGPEGCPNGLGGCSAYPTQAGAFFFATAKSHRALPITSAPTASAEMPGGFTACHFPEVGLNVRFPAGADPQ